MMNRTASLAALGVQMTLVLVAAAPASAQQTAPFVDRRELVVPARGAELVRIDNLRGRVGVRGSPRPGEIHIVAEKHAASVEILGRLRVHYTSFESGEIQIDTRVELGGRERSLPLAGSGVDLWLEVPPDVAVQAKTFGGDVSASGLRAGAKLETTGGRIGVSDVRGGVVTHQLRGGQRVVEVEGDVDLDGVEGDLDLRNLAGGRVDARVVDGNIRAEDVRADFVRLVTTTGAVVLLGVLRPAAHYDLRSYAGDVRVAVGDTPFELRARSAIPLEATAVALRWARRDGEWLRAQYLGRRTASRQRPALLELSSALARVVIQPLASEAQQSEVQ
jgi:hypothetical protein